MSEVHSQNTWVLWGNSSTLIGSKALEAQATLIYLKSENSKFWTALYPTSTQLNYNF